jgi:hypothetical protein
MLFLFILFQYFWWWFPIFIGFNNVTTVRNYFLFSPLLLAFTTCFGIYRGHLQVCFLSINNSIEETNNIQRIR